MNNTQDHTRLITDIKNCPECTDAYAFGNPHDSIHVSTDASQSGARKFRQDVIDILTSKYNGNAENVTNIVIPKKNHNDEETVKDVFGNLVKGFLKNLLKKNKNRKRVWIRLARAVFFAILIFLIVYEALEATAPSDAISKSKILTSSLIPSAIAFFTELILIAKVD